MATYTQISAESLARFLYMFDIGELEDYEAITDGIENSNYFVTLNNERKFVLTITENLDLEEVPFFNDLLGQLVNAGLPVPEPQRTLDGMPSTLLKGKPTWLFNRLSGGHIDQPNQLQCREIGKALALIHQTSAKCRLQRDNTYHASWASESLLQVQNQLSEADTACLTSVIGQYIKLEKECPTLPRGIIHGDLFRDNALFESDDLSGVIDFYHACDDYLIQDIAITINDWCIEEGELIPSLQQALLDGYNEVREINADEMMHLEKFRMFAAMRFSLTRLVAGSEHPERQPDALLALLKSLSGA